MKALGYLWSLPYGLVGLLGALLFRGLGWVESAHWRGLGLELVCRGPFVRWITRPRPTDHPQVVRRWGGFTLGWTIFFWEKPGGATATHEQHHVYQALWWGPLYPVVYLGTWLALSARHRSFARGYRNHPLERAARRAAGQEALQGQESNLR